MKNFKWDKKYLYWGVTVFCVVVASLLLFWTLNKWSDVRGVFKVALSALTPFFYGILIAYLLNKIMTPMENKLMRPLAAKLFRHNSRKARKASRIFAITLTEVLGLGVLVGLLVIVLPQIYRSIVDLVAKSQGYIEVATKWVNSFLSGDLGPAAQDWLEALESMRERLVHWLETDVLPQIGGIIATVTGGLISIVGTVLDFVIGIIISVYILYNKETFCAQLKKILMATFHPKVVQTVVQETAFINTAFGDYIAGTLIDALIIGVSTYIFMLIVGMPYTALIAIIIGVTNIIPFFGPFIGAIPSALLILLEEPVMCLVFVIFILVLQQLDGHVIKPRIHSSRSGISGFWIMFAIIFFGELFGILGMILGVPVTTVLYSVIRRINNNFLRRRNLPESTTFYKRISYIDAETGEPVYKKGFEPQPEPEPEPPAPVPDSPETEPESKDQSH